VGVCVARRLSSWFFVFVARPGRGSIRRGWFSAAWLFSLTDHVRGAFAQGDVKPATFRDPITLVVGGLDTRSSTEPENTDVLMIARIDFDQQTVHSISIPRDLFVEIPNVGYDKITRAYDYGSKANGGKFKSGAQLTRDTIETNFGIETHGTVLTTFVGFQDIVNAFGGVDVDNPYDVYDAEYPTTDYGTKEVYFEAGPNHLDGEQALEFSRTRHQDGDDARVMRQQVVLRALLDRARDPDISDSLPDIVTQHKSDVLTDLGPSKQIALAHAAPSFTNDNVTFGTLTGMIYPDSTDTGMWIYSGDWSQIPGYVQSFLAGELD